MGFSCSPAPPEGCLYNTQGPCTGWRSRGTIRLVLLPLSCFFISHVGLQNCNATFFFVLSFGWNVIAQITQSSFHMSCLFYRHSFRHNLCSPNSVTISDESNLLLIYIPLLQLNYFFTSGVMGRDYCDHSGSCIVSTTISIITIPKYFAS